MSDTLLSIIQQLQWTDFILFGCLFAIGYAIARFIMAIIAAIILLVAKVIGII